MKSRTTFSCPETLPMHLSPLSSLSPDSNRSTHKTCARTSWYSSLCLLHRNCLWRPLQKMPTAVPNKGRGKPCRGEIWVECHCGILDRSGGGQARAGQGFPFHWLRRHHCKKRGATGSLSGVLLDCHIARKPLPLGFLYFEWLERCHSRE